MDRLYPSENMASASRGLASFPVCLWRCAAWRCGAPGRTVAAAAAAPVPLTAAVRQRGPSGSASLIAPASDWKGPQRLLSFRRPSTHCEYFTGWKSKRKEKSYALHKYLLSQSRPEELAKRFLHRAPSLSSFSPKVFHLSHKIYISNLKLKKLFIILKNFNLFWT